MPLNEQDGAMPTEEEIAAQKAEADAKLAAEQKAKDEADAKAKADAEAGLGDAGKKALDAERKARQQAEKERDELKRAADEAAAAKAKADEEGAAKRGEFEKLATDRQTKLEAATATLKTLTEERDALAAQVQAYEDRDRKTITDGVKDLPADLIDFDPGDDVPLATRMAWFTKARKHAQDRQSNPAGGNGARPKPLNGADPKADEAARAAQARTTLSSF